MSKQLIPRIRVVDEEKVIAETLATILQPCGFSATFFTKPLEALNIAPSDAPSPLISDVMMPQFSGCNPLKRALGQYYVQSLSRGSAQLKWWLFMKPTS